MYHVVKELAFQMCARICVPGHTPFSPMMLDLKFHAQHILRLHLFALQKELVSIYLISNSHMLLDLKQVVKNYDALH